MRRLAAGNREEQEENEKKRDESCRCAFHFRGSFPKALWSDFIIQEGKVFVNGYFGKGRGFDDAYMI